MIAQAVNKNKIAAMVDTTLKKSLPRTSILVLGSYAVLKWGYRRSGGGDPSPGGVPPFNVRYWRFAAAVREDDPVVEGIVDNRSPRGVWPNTPIAPLTINHKEATTPQRISGAITSMPSVPPY